MQAFAVVHHGFDGVGSFCAGEFFRVGLFTADDRHCQLLLAEISVQVQNHLGFCNSFLCGFVHGVTFLPQEFTGAQERTGGLFPTDHAAPLVVQLWQVAIGFDDIFVVVAEQGLGGWTDAQAFLQLFGAAVGDPCYFGSKTFYMVLFLLEQAFRDEQRHCHVLVTGLFKFRIQDALDVFPDCIAVWTDDHTAFDRRIVAQFCFFDDVGIPFCKVDVHRGDVIDHLFIVCHCRCPPLVYTHGRHAALIPFIILPSCDKFNRKARSCALFARIHKKKTALCQRF